MNYDVIIIGAGISGLIAAHTILDKEPSLDVLILEAKDRIGGRTLSLPVEVKRNNTCLFDFGGHWVSRSQKHIMKYLELLQLNMVPQQRGLAIAACKNNAFETYEEIPIVGNRFTSYELKWFFGLLDEQSEMYSFSVVQNKFIKDFYDSISMEYLINSKMYTKAGKNIAQNMIKNITGVDASQISVLYYLLLCNSCLGFTNQYMNKDGGAREFWIEEGAHEICKRLNNLLQDACLVLNDPVVEISHPVVEINHPDLEKIVIKTSSGKKYSAAHVICAIPPEEILEIKFDPPLTAHKKKILKKSQTGHIVKFVITYNTPFWRYQGNSGEIIACEDGPIILCYDATKSNNPALTGYIKEPFNLYRGPEGTCEKSVVEQLQKYWGRAALDYIEYKEHIWWGEPYVGGCPMTCVGLDTAKWYYTMTNPMGRIHWAGTETATQWNGYMSGAVQAGYRAAINILYDIRPQCLTVGDITTIQPRVKHIIRIHNFHIGKTSTVAIGLLATYLVYKYYIKH